MPRPRSRLRRFLAVSTALGLALPAAAQTAAPPARVGQLTGVSGSVSYNGAGSNGQWATATENYPITSGDTVYTQDGGQASIAIGTNRVSLAPSTELQVTELDDSAFMASESQGEVFLSVSSLGQGQAFTLTTPRGAVNIVQPGQYEILAGDANTPATVNVYNGEAEANGAPVYAGQAAYLSGGGQPQIGQAQRDAFAGQAMAQNAPPPPPYVPPAVLQMTGVTALSSYGTWENTPQYGAVWYPAVALGWAPYHYGHWAYVVPWGWTWVDNEPWGFAPFHYGRWVQIYGRWAWVPAPYAAGGYVTAPVYAPALVAFFGLSVGVAITAEALSEGDIGWVPLGPDEPYYPHYRCPPDYLRRVNGLEVRDPGHVDFDHPPGFEHYVNHGAALYGPARGFAQGEQVRHYAQPVPHAMFGQAQPVGRQFPQQMRPQFTPHPAPAPEGHGITPPGQGFHPQQQGPQHQPQMPQVITPETPPPQHGAQPQFQHPQQPQGGGWQQPQPFHPQAQPSQQPQGGGWQQQQPFHPQAQPPQQPQGGGWQQQQPFHPQAQPPQQPQGGGWQQQQPFHPQAQPSQQPQGGGWQRQNEQPQKPPNSQHDHNQFGQ